MTRLASAPHRWSYSGADMAYITGMLPSSIEEVVHSKLALSLLITSIFAFYWLYLRPYYLSGIKNVPGPVGGSLISGHLTAIFKAEASALHQEWVEKYGPVLMYRGFLGSNRLYITDTKALMHVLVNKAYEYPKPAQTRDQLARILGKGVLVVEHEEHRKQRRIMNGPFTQASVNSYLPIFLEQTDKMCDKISKAIDEDQSKVPGNVKNDDKDLYSIVNVSNWLSRATLDVIGLAGFDYAFNSLDNDQNELANAFNSLTRPRSITVAQIFAFMLSRYIPAVSKIPFKSVRDTERSRKVMKAHAETMIAERKAMSAEGLLDDKKDLLSLIVKANMEAKDPKDQLSDESVQGQVSTFMLAGHETSAVALTWTLLYLARDLDLQQRLRKEVQAVQEAVESRGDEAFNPDDIARMPFLDAVVRESLRCSPPVVLTVRESAHDDVIPLSEPVIGRDGKSISAINVERGQQVMIGISMLNQSKAIFGEDAATFRPDRWQDGSMDKTIDKGKGFTAWAPLLTFLGGVHGCIGYKFSILEVKVMLAKLVMTFEFLERDVGGTPVTKKSNIVTRPVIVGEEDKGSQLPLRMRRVRR